MNKYYVNVNTGECTENHKTAVEWFREGSNIEIWVNGIKRLTWEH